MVSLTKQLVEWRGWRNEGCKSVTPSDVTFSLPTLPTFSWIEKYTSAEALEIITYLFVLVPNHAFSKWIVSCKEGISFLPSLTKNEGGLF